MKVLAVQVPGIRDKGSGCTFRFKFRWLESRVPSNIDSQAGNDKRLVIYCTADKGKWKCG